MIKPFILKQINILRHTSLKDKADAKAVSALFLFLVLNALKITLFNYYIIPTQTLETFKYKFIMTILLFLIIYTVIFIIKYRAVFLTIYILQIIYLLTYLSYYLYFHSYLHLLQWVTLFTEGLMAARHFAAPKSLQLLIAFIDMPIFIYIAINYLEIHAIKAKLGFFRALVISFSLLAVFYIETRNYAQGYSFIQLINDRYKGESPIVQRYGTVVNSIAGLFLNKGEKDLINSFEYGKEQLNNKEVQDNPNFVIIQVESMDSNVINQKYKDSYIAPYLHSLSGESIYYPYVLSYHKGGGTSDTEFSIINSVEPLDGFPAMKLSNYDYPNSMLSKLAEASYHTIAFHGNVGSFFNRDTAFPKMGFIEFFDMPKMNMKDIGWGAPDSEVFNFAANKLKNLRQPYLSYIITMTSHGPFTNASNYYNNNRYDDIKDETVRNFFNSMSYVDQSIRDFVTYIKSNFKNTYIFILGDHTPNINTDIYKKASFTYDNKYFEFVPLFVITPDNKVYKEDKRVASFLDISPTILYASGIQFKINSNGHNLINSDGNFNKIPFKGSNYERTYLFDKINKLSAGY